jgi:hypothetical protein
MVLSWCGTGILNMAVTLDSSTPAVVTTSQGSVNTSVTTASFSPPAESLCVAMCAINYANEPAGNVFPSMVITDSVGNTWSAGTAQQSSINAAATVQVFIHYFATVPGAITVMFGRGSDNAAAMMGLAVQVTDGASSIQSGAGNAVNTGSNGSASLTVTTTETGSAVYVVGDISSNQTPNPAPESGTSSISSTNDASDGGWLEFGNQSPYATATPGVTGLG